MDIRKLVGENVRRYRLAAELSQEQVAERMDVDRAYISGLELGARNPTVVTLWHAAEALGVPAAALLEMPTKASAVPKTRKRAPKRIKK